MTWALAALGLVLFGAFATRLDLDWAARIAIAFTCGIVIGGSLMYVESLIGIAWSPWTVGLPAILCAVSAGWRLSPAATGRRNPPEESVAVALLFLLTLYGAATARITTGDLLYFWGPKAQHFFNARGIDVEFLRFPHYYLMHSDYPPLLPLLSVWSSIWTGSFSYWGAVLLGPLLLLAAVVAFRGYSQSGLFAVLLAAVLTFGFAAGRVAGGADPLLLLFEIVALSALTFRRSRADDLVAAIALAGAAFTKVEGAAFVAVVIAATIITRRSARPLLLAIPAAILLGSWIVFSKQHGLLDSYGRAGTPLHLDRLGFVAWVTGHQISYGAFYLPWVASLAPLAFARNWRRAALPLIVGAASIACAIYFYLHEPDPAWWIKASAERVLLTSLASFVVASAAASE
jgi:hypothetical protein